MERNPIGWDRSQPVSLYFQMADSKVLILTLAVSMVILMRVSDGKASQSDIDECRRNCSRQFYMCVFRCHLRNHDRPGACYNSDCSDGFLYCFTAKCRKMPDSKFN